MEYFRLYQYLTRGQNIKHIDKELTILKDRFDNELFDILAARNSDSPCPVGIYLSENSEETLQKLPRATEWLNKFNGDLYIITERPKDFAQGNILQYRYKNGHRFTKPDDLVAKALDAGVPDIVLGYLAKKSPSLKLAKTAWQMYKKLN